MAQEQLGPAVKRGGDRIANEALCSPGFTSERLFKESLEVARPSGHLFSGTLPKLLLFKKKKNNVFTKTHLWSGLPSTEQVLLLPVRLTQLFQRVWDKTSSSGILAIVMSQRTLVPQWHHTLRSGRPSAEVLVQPWQPLVNTLEIWQNVSVSWLTANTQLNVLY